MNPLAALLAWLGAFHPALPWALLTAVIFGAVYSTRNFLPSLWVWFDKISPDGLVGNVFQALPSVLAGALATAFTVGEDYDRAWLGALSGALAPVVHHLLKIIPGPYNGAARKIAEKAGLVTLVLLTAIGCSAAERQAARTVLDAARTLCLLSHAESLGVSPEEVAETLCDAEEEFRPWVPHVLGAQRAGAAEIGLKAAP